MIKLTELSKKFKIGNGHIQTIFDQAEFFVQAGTSTAIKGRSGSGKTSLLKILAGLDIAYSGKHQYFEELMKKDISTMADYRLKQVGIVEQNHQLLVDRTCYENIAIPLKCLKFRQKQIRDMVDSVIELLDIKDFIHRYPYELSGGQCQCVSIARAIVKAPSLLILDEPTGALDQESECKVLEILSQLVLQGQTLIVATHSDVVTKRCDQIYEIDNYKLSRII